MEIPSIRELADMVMDLVRIRKMSFREALHSVADEYETDHRPIQKELNFRSAESRRCKKKRTIAEKAKMDFLRQIDMLSKRAEWLNRKEVELAQMISRQEKEDREYAEEIPKLRKKAKLRDAQKHEMEMRSGFIRAGHMSDYH